MAFQKNAFQNLSSNGVLGFQVIAEVVLTITKNIGMEIRRMRFLFRR